MSSYTEVFGGYVVGTAFPSLTTINLTASNTQQIMVWPTQFTTTALPGNTIANRIDVTATNPGYSIVMPEANQVSPGIAIQFNNLSSNNVTLYAADGVTVLTTINGPSVIEIYLYDNTFASIPSPSIIIGRWRIIPSGGGFSAVTSIGLTSSTANIVIGGSASPITTSGTFTLALGGDLGQLAGFGMGGIGFPARIANNTWALRQLTVVANQLVVTNPAGVAADPILGLASTITGINSLTVGNVQISGNSLITINSNGNFNVSPNGIGETIINSNVQILNGHQVRFQNPLGTFYTNISAGNQTSNITLTWPTIASTIGQALIDVDGSGHLGWANISTFGGPSTLDAIAKYSNTSGSLTNSGVFISNLNAVTGISALAVANLDLGLATPGTISTTAGNLEFSPNGTSETYSNTNLSVRNGNLLKLWAPLNPAGGFVSFKSGVGVVQQDYTLPLTQGAAGDTYAITNGSGVLSSGTIPGGNRLINGDMLIWQRGTTFNASGATIVKLADGWAVKTLGAASVDVTRENGAVTGQFNMKVQRTAGNADPNPIVVSQTLTNDMCVGMASQRCALSFNLKVGANFSGTSATIQIFSGTQAVDVGYLTTGFTSQATEGSLVIVGPPTTLTYYPVPTTTTCQAAATQFAIVFSYTPSNTPAGADDSFSITTVQFERSFVPTPFQRLSFPEQFVRARRIYRKSFLYSTAPAQNVGINTGELMFMSGGIAAVNLNAPSFNFGSPMRAIPTITLYNPAAASGEVRNETRSENCTATATVNISDSGFSLSATGSAATVVGDRMGIHYTADAQLS